MADRFPYTPVLGRVLNVKSVSQKERLFVVGAGPGIAYKPGQFFMVGLPGYGEAPISVTSQHEDGKDSFELCIRAVGDLTNALHRLKDNDAIWYRGPFGTSFPLTDMKGKDIVFIAGGIGIVPMRSLVLSILAQRGDYKRLTLIYGARTDKEFLFLDEAKAWKDKGVDVLLTVDKVSPEWKGPVGVVTTLMPQVDMNKDTVAVVIGPPVMYKFVIRSLRDKGVLDDNIYLSLERRMKCGLGKCGHCQINSAYVCCEGPVFRLDNLKGLYEAL